MMITISEAAQIWNTKPDAIRYAIKHYLKQPEEARQSGSIWLVSSKALEKVMGDPERIGDTVSVAQAATLVGIPRTMVYYYLPSITQGVITSLGKTRLTKDAVQELKELVALRSRKGK